MEWITLILTVSVVIISFHLLFGKSHPNAPPCIRGWIPWFGAAFEFGKAPLHFIQQARAKVSLQVEKLLARGIKTVYDLHMHVHFWISDLHTIFYLFCKCL